MVVGTMYLLTQYVTVTQALQTDSMVMSVMVASSNHQVVWSIIEMMYWNPSPQSWEGVQLYQHLWQRTSCLALTKAEV